MEELCNACCQGCTMCIHFNACSTGYYGEPYCCACCSGDCSSNSSKTPRLHSRLYEAPVAIRMDRNTPLKF